MTMSDHAIIDDADSRKQIVDISADLKSTTQCFVSFLIPGIVLVGCGMIGKSIAALCTAGLWALACLASGAALGFLFGIPKILQSKPDSEPLPSSANNTTSPLSNGGVAASNPRQGLGYAQRVNTNLEEISDWLTKIVVGLGLVNLAKVPNFLNSVAERLANELGGTATSLRFFALGVILYFSIIGMLAGYLFTRLFLQRAFARADLSVTPENAMAISIQGVNLQISGSDPEAAKAASDALRMIDRNLNTTLTPEEKDLLQQFVQAQKPIKLGEGGILPGFARGKADQILDANMTQQLKQLRALRGFSLIRPVGSKNFFVGTQIEVTDFGKFVAEKQRSNGVD